MEVPAAINHLDQHQARTLALAEQSLQLIRRSPEEAQPELAKLRWELLRVVRAYQLFKHVELFDPAITRGSPEQAATALRLKTACVAAGEDFQRHVARWSATDIRERWPEYQAAVRIMVTKLQAHLARERDEVRRLFAGADRTRKLRAS